MRFVNVTIDGKHHRVNLDCVTHVIELSEDAIAIHLVTGKKIKIKDKLDCQDFIKAMNSDIHS